MSDAAEQLRINTAELRKAAVESHWLPDMRLRLSQPRRAEFFVGTGGVVDPCAFRQLVSNWLAAGSDPALLEPFDLHRPLTIDRRLARGEIDGDSGMIMTTFDIHHTVVAFSAIIAPPGELPQGQPVEHVLDGVTVVEAFDAELGVSLVHASHHTADWAEGEHVTRLMSELHASRSVGSVEAHLADVVSHPTFGYGEAWR